VLVDVMSATTTPSYQLCPKELDVETFSKLSKIEHHVFITQAPIPIPILSAIISINHLRIRLRAQMLDGPANTCGPDEGLHAKIQALVKTIDAFDPEEWAKRIIKETFPTSGVEQHLLQYRETELFEWTSLGQSYKSATMILLLRAVGVASLRDEEMPSACNLSSAEGRLNQEVSTLSSNVDQLMLSFGDKQPPNALRPGLWRFTTWPLYIHALELLLWHEPCDQGLTRAKYLARLHLVATAVGSRTLQSAAESIEMALLLKDTSAGSVSLQWDDLFTGRTVFVY
jgi:hypothetical protein